MGLGDRDYEKRPAMGLKRAPDDRLPVAQPRLMNERTPAPTAVPPLAVDDLPQPAHSFRSAASHGGRI
jgi:hypothetical protein